MRPTYYFSHRILSKLLVFRCCLLPNFFSVQSHLIHKQLRLALKQFIVSHWTRLFCRDLFRFLCRLFLARTQHHLFWWWLVDSLSLRFVFLTRYTFSLIFTPICFSQANHDNLLLKEKKSYSSLHMFLWSHFSFHVLL